MTHWSDEQKDFWDENGYLVVENALSSSEVEVLRGSLVKLEEQARTLTETTDRYIFSLFGADGGGKRVQQIAEPHEFGGDFVTLARDRRILDVIEGMIGPDILLYYSMLMMKPPSAGAPAPWHQDMSFFVHDNARLVAAQVYLDDATEENGCVRVVPGSHRYGLLNHFDGDRFTGIVQGDTNDFDNNRKSVIVPAGSIAFWHCLTLHSSEPNRSLNPRRAVVFEYKDPSARLMSGSFSKSEVRQAGMMVRGADPSKELLPAF
ncbi:MAG: phytanoyl-CoA dioxygenase family protein [Nocardioidaceae bacterium]